jgi:DNA-binding beta-propeller fold protein YncE
MTITTFSREAVKQFVHLRVLNFTPLSGRSLTQRNNMQRNRNSLLFHFSIFLLASFIVLPPRAVAQQKPPASELLPTGQAITPMAVPGAQFQTLKPGSGHKEVGYAVSNAVRPDGNTLLVLTSGYNQVYGSKGVRDAAASKEFVFVFDISSGAPKQLQALPVTKAFGGIVWNPNGTEFYVAGGVDDVVHVFAVTAKTWAESGTPIPLGHKVGLGLQVKPMAAGIGITADGTRLVIANYENDSVTIVDVAARKVAAELDLRPGKSNAAQAGVPGGEFPYGVAVHGNDRAYISSVRDRELIVVDLAATPRVAARIALHGQPNKMAFNHAQTRLYVAEDNSDTLAVVDEASNKVLGELGVTAPRAILAKLGGFKGSNPNSVTLAPDEKIAYVTLGGANAVAVVRLSAEGIPSEVEGLIPTAWYPNAVSLNRAGTILFVANGKSVTGPNPENCRKSATQDRDDAAKCRAANQYILQLIHGGLLTTRVPNAANLADLTTRVSENNRWPEIAVSTAASTQMNALRGKIHHVIYIIKENRSYDQVLGDLEKGNGDPKLAILPEPVSPNHHQLARQFITFDNLMASGEVSGDGWNWSTAARGTDALEKDVPNNYDAGGQLSYDYEGENRNLNVGIADMAARRKADPVTPADPDLLPGTADVIAPDGPGGPGEDGGAGYLWDSALRAGLSLRNYGFFLDMARYESSAATPGHMQGVRDAFTRGIVEAFPTKVALAPVTDLYFPPFDLTLPDYWRFKEWAREFDAYAASGKLPSLELVRLPHDHFGDFGTAIDGVNTVETEMADNDYAIGLIVQKIAASPFAKDTVIFIIEDDAQNGPDHMDAHRTVGLVAGAYVRQGAVVSTRYTTVNMLRTIEELLGMKPMGLNDAAAAPMADAFSGEYAEWSYAARVPAVLRTTKLPLPPASSAPPPSDFDARYSHPRYDAVWWEKHMRGQNFSVEDDLDTPRFNRALWLGLVGPGVPFPSHTTGIDLSRDREQLLEKYRAAQSNLPKN